MTNATDLVYVKLLDNPFGYEARVRVEPGATREDLEQDVLPGVFYGLPDRRIQGRYLVLEVNGKVVASSRTMTMMEDLDGEAVEDFLDEIEDWC